MGITERKEREKLALRRKIVEAAKAMFIAEGYEKTSLRKIAKRIEYSPGTLYLHFKNKNELFYTVHEEGFAIFLDGMKNAKKGIDSPYEQLRAMGRYYLQFAHENPELYDLMFIMNAPMEELPEEEWGCGKASYKMLEDTIQEAVQQGEVQTDNVELAAFSLFSFMHGMTSLAIKNRMEMKRDLPSNVIEVAMETMMQQMRNESR